jgi:dihydrofolate reductase
MARTVDESQNKPPPAIPHDITRNPPRLALIAAVAANRVIGAHNTLPWRLPEDLQRFRALTLGHSVIMGRNTWESLDKPLVQRQNIVVTRHSDYAAPGADIAASLEEALRIARLPPPVFCIGGGEIYRAALPYADTLYLTLLDRAFTGDVTFPDFDSAEWCEVNREPGTSAAPEHIGYQFITFERRSIGA